MAKRLEEKVNSHRGFKANLTRKLNSADRLLAQATSLPPSRTVFDQLTDAQDSITKAYESVEQSIRELQSIDDPKEFEAYEDKLNDEFVRSSKMKEALTEVIVDYETTLAPKQQQVPYVQAGGPRTKPNETLKPKPLTRENNPVELRAWVERFTAFFISSRLSEATEVEQQAHFKACLDAYLNSRLHQHIKPNTPILPDPTSLDRSCIELLQDEFLVQHPLFSRRLDFFNFKQSSGQAFTDWYQKLRKKGDEADLAAMTVDDLYTMRCFTGVTDPELKREFLKQPKKDSATLTETADNYEMARRYVKAMGTPAANNTATRKKGNNPGNTGRMGGNGATNAVSNDDSRAKQIFKEGKCFRCGHKVDNRKEHAIDCKAKDHTCRHCGKVGHYPSVCLTGGAQASGQSRGRSQTRGNTQTRSNSIKPATPTNNNTGNSGEIEPVTSANATKA